MLASRNLLYRAVVLQDYRDRYRDAAVGEPHPL
jgi:hypothetical protein